MDYNLLFFFCSKRQTQKNYLIFEITCTVISKNITDVIFKNCFNLDEQNCIIEIRLVTQTGLKLIILQKIFLQRAYY